MRGSQGRRRLRILLGATAGFLCLLLMAIVLVFYGPPYNPLWWLIMAIILIGACAITPVLARPIEWVIEGYQQPGKSE